MGKCLFIRKAKFHTAPYTRLPYGYIELAYILLSGTQYINTGVRATENTKFEVRFKNNQSENSAIISADKEWVQNSFGVWINSSIAVPVINNNLTTINVSYNSNYDDFTLSKNGFYINNNLVWNLSGINIDSFQTPVNLVIGATNRNGTISENFIGKIYFCKIYENDILIRNFIPCINDCNEVGMFDIKGKQFYNNAGTGSFIAGSEVA